ncbi:hypothetical protein STANM337S_06505 [Streptomyces tanashiensis]
MKKRQINWQRMRRAIVFGLVRGAATTTGGLVITGIMWWVQRT